MYFSKMNATGVKICFKHNINDKWGFGKIKTKSRVALLLN